LKEPQEYRKETDFSKDLSNFLDWKTIMYQKGLDMSSIIETTHQTRRNNGIPDIKVEIKSPIKMKWRYLTNPFFIECKMDNIEVLYWLNQILRYKYKPGSENQCRMEKYGDYHVVVSTPNWLEDNIWRNIPTNENNWLSNFFLVRVLWHLGIGVLVKERGIMKIYFNEHEVLEIE